MRKPRILGSTDTCRYHVMSRVVNRDFIFGSTEKEYFRRTMRKLEAFTGVQVLTYCIMSNHFHILLEIKSIHDLSDKEILSRITQFYSKQRAKSIITEFQEAQLYAEETGNDQWLQDLRVQYLSRMNNLSVFVKELKERFSKWYNRRNDRRGTLWEERFKSVLIENTECATATIAAYIDLNPVRAGIVEDPSQYHFCGYAEAIAGDKRAREGITRVLDTLEQNACWRTIITNYRRNLLDDNGSSSIHQEQIKQDLDRGTQLNKNQLLRCKVRYFSDGVAIGSKLFVEEVFESHRNLFSERRKTGARKLKGGNWEDLFSLRNLTHAVTLSG